jgi:transcriptional regulator with XRE-family HTH domain
MKTSKTEISRTLNLLRAKLQQRRLTQQAVQNRLGWGKNYLSEMFLREKTLQVRQILAVLRAIGVAPAAFYAELYGWPLDGLGAAARPPADGWSPEAIFAEVEREVARLLQLLRTKIHENGFTQVEIQKRLGWGSSYVSQLLRRAKTLRLDQALAILGVLGVGPAEFYAELYAPAWAAWRFERLLAGGQEALLIRAVCRVLTAKGMISEEEVLAAMTVAESERRPRRGESSG